MIYPSASIRIRHKNCHVEFGDNIVFGCNYGSYSVVSPTKARIITQLDNAILTIGNRTNIFGANRSVASKISIGNDCQIACGVNILDYNGHRTDCIPRDSDMDSPKPITIGNNVWIGANVIIPKGTVLGDNTVVGAGSVVKGEYPSNCVVLGNPAKIIKRI